METLAELIETNGVTAYAFYTDTVDEPSRSGNLYDRDSYDVLFTIEVGPSLYGGLLARRTLLFRGWEQAAYLSRANNGGDLTPPTVRDVFPTLVDIARTVDQAEGGWQAWAEEYWDGREPSQSEAIGSYALWRTHLAIRNDLVAFLGGAEPFGLYDRMLRATSEDED